MLLVLELPLYSKGVPDQWFQPLHLDMFELPHGALKLVLNKRVTII